ncbi:MAG: deoxyribodipyrimidine photo-lyase [Parvularculaceae bacterium]
MTAAPVIVLFRRDLRLADNPSLAAAAASGRPVIAVYVLDDTEPHPIRGAQKWWLHRSLLKLQAALVERGSFLVLRRNNTSAALADLARETGADLVHWARRYTRAEIETDQLMTQDLAAAGVTTKSFMGGLLREPQDMASPSAGGPYRVFTPFFRRLSEIGPAACSAPAFERLMTPSARPSSESLDDWRLLPKNPDWAAEFSEHWRPGEAGAWAAADAFVEGPIASYAEQRDIPAIAGTTRLSPHLAFGEASPTALWNFISAAGAARRLNIEKVLSEIAWREFSHHLLHAFPQMATTPLQPKFEGFAYRDDAEGFRHWTRGLTGYPVVDAGMRQLWRTGWMHNRVRMIVASFLTKDLLIDWRRGAEWFAQTLVDFDPASNAANWQWVAGCGADAAPFFRIFNPTTQGEKFDPQGDYVRRFVPELADLPAEHIHRPDAAPAGALAAAKVRIGVDYPAPVVDHAEARRRALAAFESIGPPVASRGTRPHVQ